MMIFADRFFKDGLKRAEDLCTPVVCFHAVDMFLGIHQVVVVVVHALVEQGVVRTAETVNAMELGNILLFLYGQVTQKAKTDSNIILTFEDNKYQSE